jgi:hypothetical protein
MVATQHKTFGGRIRFAMDTRPGGAVSISALAAKCGVTYQGAKKWLDADTAKLAAEAAAIVATETGVDLVWLITGKGQARGLPDDTQQPEAITHETVKLQDLPDHVSRLLGSLSGLQLETAITAIRYLIDDPEDIGRTGQARQQLEYLANMPSAPPETDKSKTLGGTLHDGKEAA